MYLVTIGTPESGAKFAERTGFPADQLLVDPQSALYDVLPFNRGIRATFFKAETGKAISERMKSGTDATLKSVLKDYTMLMPPRTEQAFIQGGVLLFQGPELVWAHFDPSTAAHADLGEVVRLATEGL